MELNIIQAFINLCDWMEISIIPYLSNTVNKYIDYKKDKELFSVVNLFTDGDISKEIYLLKKEECEKKNSSCKKQINDLVQKEEKALTEKDVINRKRAIIQLLSIAPYKQERKILDEIIDRYVERIEVDDIHMNWILRIPNGENELSNISVINSKESIKIKGKFTPLTPNKNYVPCTTQNRQL